jgi:MFS family permease
MLIQCVGHWIRQFLRQNFYVCIAGQILIALGNPFICNMSSKLSATWFPVRERMFTTVISMSMQYFGFVFGFYMAGWMMIHEPITDGNYIIVEKSRNLIRQDLGMFALVEAVMQTVLTITVFLLFKQMYVNSYGQRSSVKDFLSDFDCRESMLLSNKSLQLDHDKSLDNKSISHLKISV